jgi:hypothetical protein
MMVSLFGTYQKEIFRLLTVLCFVLFSAIVFCSFTPPGTEALKLGDQLLYVDKTEVVNKSWAEYLYYLKKKFGERSLEYHQALPDSLVWNTIYSGDIRRLNGEFSDYPVVGISYLQAIDFCKWRSARVQEKYGMMINYRLPSREEWEKIAGYFEGENSSKGLKKCEWKKGVHNLTDNVSEMVMEEGVAMGMNWQLLDTLTSPIPNQVMSIHYTAPDVQIGFRCVSSMN